MKGTALRRVAAWFALAILCCGSLPAQAQGEYEVVFEDDFSSDTLNPAKFQPDSPFFEGGRGDIHAELGDGVLRFVGTTTQQWWSGATVRVVPVFNATEATPVRITVDRVAEAGVGTASRSALWILDETGTRYVLFADVRAEGGWHYNRKIGEDGDNPTGSGTDIPAFNDPSHDDGGLHQMSMVADGSTVKLFLDGVLGAEVKFPFTRVVFHLGSYARANDDTADTTWDNLKIEQIPPPPRPPLFEDDFSSNTIDPSRYQPDAPFFEGGLGDIHAEPGDGVMRFVGTTTQQWWSGSTLRIVPTFAPSEAEIVTISIDRVAEAGVGTASRSALWILDETMTRYVLFADVRAEGGWRYNRKIGEDGDNPTGSGTDILLFNDPIFDDGGLHRMSMVADGRTVKLLLDGLQGAEVKFPFSPVIFQFGSYARAAGDTADTTWDNLLIESAGSATFGQTFATVREGELGPEIPVRIPQGLNSQEAVEVRIVSSDPAVAVPEGATGGSLTLQFAAGATNVMTFRPRGLVVGGAQFTLEGPAGAGNRLQVAVISGPGLLLEENFSGASIDTTKWEISYDGFEPTGSGIYTVGQVGGVLEIVGNAETDYWSGASIKTVKSHVATPDLPLVFEVDRVLTDVVGTAARTGVYITTDDRSRYVFFGQDVFETEWQVNVNPGNPTGSGTAVAAFVGDTEWGTRRLKLVADGRTVEVFLDGVSGGVFPFEVSSGIHFEIGTYARASFDYVLGHFDNVRIENVLPCTTVAPANLTMTEASSGLAATVTVPQLLNDAAPVTVTVTSRNPAVAVPEGAVNGVLTLEFPAGGATTRSFIARPVGRGSTVFDVATTPSSCVEGSIAVEVVAVPETLLADDFSSGSLDQTKWVIDDVSFDTGFPTATSGVTLENGLALIRSEVEIALWAGFAVETVESFTAAPATPLTFEIDRVRVEFDLFTGTGAEQKTGVRIRDDAGHWVLFTDYLAHDGRSYGWRYNKVTGEADDNPTNEGVNIAAFDGPRFDDRANHRVRLVANGQTVKLYLDDEFGAEVPFPFSEGLKVAFVAYADEVGNVVRGFFDNALVLGGENENPPTRLTTSAQGGNVVISWTGGGTLEESPALGAGANWSPVTPAPAGNTHTVTPGAAAGARFYRVRQ